MIPACCPPLRRNVHILSPTLLTAACLATIAMMLPDTVAHAQGASRTVSAWVAVARNQPLKTRAGETNDRDLYFAGIRIGKSIYRATAVDISYSADLIPVVVSTGMPVYTDSPTPCPPGERDCVISFATPQSTMRHSVHGAGIVPIGVDARFRIVPGLGLIVHAGAGVLYFSRPVPDPEERRLNFMFDVGPALDLAIGRSASFTVGYHLNHISNSGRGPVNPAMDSRTLEIGMSLVR